MRATEAAESAINNPLLDDSSMKGAKAVLINITGGMDMTLFEVDEAANRIRTEVDPDAIIIFGSAFDEKLEGVMRVSVVATGIDALSQSTPQTFAENDAARTGAINEISPAAKMKQVINFGHISSSPFAPAADDSLPAESPTDALEEAELQAEPTPSLAQQIKSEKKIGDAADDNDSSQVKNSMTLEHGQLDLETAAKLVDTRAAVKEEEPTDDIHIGADSLERATQLTEGETHEQASIIQRPAYIPAATKDVGTDDEVVSASAETSTRPGLLNRFTGIWASKPADNPGGTQSGKIQGQDKPANKTEPVLNRADVTLPNVEQPVIMDLPAVDVVQPSLPVTTAKLDDEDDDLDIPAILRRQAN